MPEKESYCARVHPETLELQVLHICPTMENLKKYATIGGEGFFELHRIGLGLELYCDEDASMKQESFTCNVRWQNRIDPKGPPAEVAFRGPVLILDRRATSLPQFLEKVTQVVQPVDRPLRTGSDPQPPSPE